MRRMNLLFTLTVVLMMLFSTVAAAANDSFPKIIQLPNGWRPEGIAAGKGNDFYVGSLANGAVYKGDLRTGVGAILVPGQTGRLTVGLKYSERSKLLFTAGGGAGVARVFSGETGAEVATIPLSGAPAFINDVVVTREAAYFTNSQKPEVYKVLLANNGELTNPVQVQTLTLSGDWQQVTGFNANGIDATNNGKQLIVVNSTTGLLYTVDPNSGVSKHRPGWRTRQRWRWHPARRQNALCDAQSAQPDCCDRPRQRPQFRADRSYNQRPSFPCAHHDHAVWQVDLCR